MPRSVRSSLRRSPLAGLVVGVSAVATVLAGCGSSGGGSSQGPSSSAAFVSGGTFSFAVSADPGNLDPQSTAASIPYQLSFFAYDTLLGISAKGAIESQLASKWKAAGQTVTLTLKPGITCSDGSAFTAATAAANINYIVNPSNKSPFNGVYIPAGAKATASGNTLTLQLAGPAPFVLDGLAETPMVCAKGMADRSTLATRTDGTGPYTLTSAVSNNAYTYTKRSGYTWGPDGATTKIKGLPDKIVVKVIPNETTAANLLLSGGLNAASFLGPDIARLQAAKLYEIGTPAPIGEMWYNQGKGRLLADPKLRQALTESVNLAQLQKVLTSGRGAPATTFAEIPPVACPGNSIAKALPSSDLAKAKALLDADGWTAGAGGIRSKNGTALDLTLLYDTTYGSAGSAAAELAAQQWKKLGAKISLVAQDDTTQTNTLFGSGNWDISWVTLGVSSPDQLVGFLSGTAPPAGENFSHINDPAYNADIAQAMKLPGSTGCSHWLAAESNLVRDSDVIPFASQVQETFGKGAQFQVVGDLLPTTIRMTG